MDDSSFYVDLPSDASLETNPNNQGGKYTVMLPQTIRLSAYQWEVGLAEIVFRQDWQPVVPSDIWVSFYNNNKTGGTYSHAGGAILDEKDAKKWTTTDTFQTCWENAIKPLLEAGLKNSGLWKEAATKVEVIQNTKSGRVKFIFTDVKNKDELPVRVEMSHSLLQILGFSRNQLPVEGRYFQTNVDHKLETPESVHSPAVSRGISSLWVYSDIVRPHITGHSFSPLLRIIGVEEKKYGTRVEQFDRIHYFTLLSKLHFRRRLMSVRTD